MSTDFIALFDVRAEGATAEWLLARVLERPAQFAGFVERYGAYFRAQAWALEAIRTREERSPSVVGPGGFILDLDHPTLRLWHGIRFGMFTGDAWHREALRRVCAMFAGLVGSTRAICTHELMPYEHGVGLDGIEAGLRARIGPPAETFEQLDAAEYFGPHAWYIDTFTDLRAQPEERGEQP